MSKIEHSVDVDVPVREAYDQWTQFEEFPRFMEGVEAVRQLDDTHLQWTAKVAGRTKEWRAEVTEQRPDERVAWKAESGTENAGVVTFHKLDEGRCRVAVQIDAEPEGIVEKAGDALGVVERRVKADLERFREFIEGRGQSTGAWRGRVEGGTVEDDDASTAGPGSNLTGTGTAAGTGQ